MKSGKSWRVQAPGSEVQPSAWLVPDASGQVSLISVRLGLAHGCRESLLLYLLGPRMAGKSLGP